ncbi:MAG: tyrosine-type recombinase/integrase [Enterococcus sp.]
MAEPKQLKNGMYKLRLRFKHPFTGKWIERTTTQKSKKLCKEWEIKTLADNLVGMNPDKVKLLPFYQTWYETYKKDSVGRERRKKLEQAEKHLKKYFDENIYLHQIDRVTYQQFINHLGVELNLAKSTVTEYHIIYKAVFIEAQESGFIKRNPARNAKMVGRDTSEEKKRTLTMEEWEKLLQVMLKGEESSSKYAAITMLFLGLRFQETVALTIGDIDLNKRIVSISKAFDYKETKDFTKTKTAGAIRNVDIPSPLFDILKERIKAMKGNSKIVSIDSREVNKKFLFPNELGIPITNAAINKYIKKCCRVAKIEEVTSHAFRHAKTDMLVLAGADMIYTQKQLGHADPSTTLRYYSALNSDIKTKNQNIMNQFLEDIL